MKRYILIALLAVSGSLRAVDDSNPISESEHVSLLSVLGLRCVMQGMRAAAQAVAEDPHIRGSVRDFREFITYVIDHDDTEDDERQEDQDTVYQSNNNAQDSEVILLQARERDREQLALRKRTEEQVRAALHAEH